MAAINDTIRNAMVTSAAGLFDGATIQIRSGAPAGVGTTATGELLATLVAGTPAFGAASGGTCTALAVTQDSNAAGGTAAAAHFRVTGTGAIMEGTVTASGGGGEMQLDSVSITAGDTVRVDSWTLTQPA